MTQDVTGSNRERFEKTIRKKERLSGFQYDLAKTSFTMMVLAGLGCVFAGQLNYGVVCSVLFGTIGTIGFAFLANRIMNY